MIYGWISSKPSVLCREILSISGYFCTMFKAVSRVVAAGTVTLLAFSAVGSFLSWIEHQEDSVADTWVDEDEFEDA